MTKDFALLWILSIVVTPLLAQLPPCALGNSGARAILESNPVGYYPLSELVHPVIYNRAATGSVGNGQYYNSPILGQPGISPPPNTQDPSVSFNDQALISEVFASLPGQQYGILPNIPEYRDASISVELWTFPTDAGGLSLRVLYDGLTAAGGMRIYVALDSPPTCEMKTPTGSMLLTGGVHLTTVLTWSHFACTYDAATSTGSLYADGQWISSQTFTYVPNPTATDIYLARGVDGDGTHAGRLDELAIFDYALSANQVALHWEAIFVYKYFQYLLGPTAYWGFEEDLFLPSAPPGTIRNRGTGGSDLDLIFLGVPLSGIPDPDVLDAALLGALPGVGLNLFTNRPLPGALLSVLGAYQTNGYKASLNTPSFTIILYAQNFGLGGGPIINSNGNTAGNQGYRIASDLPNPPVNGTVRSGSILIPTSTSATLVPPSAGYNHYALTYNATTGYFAWYLNGEPYSSTNSVAYTPATSGRTFLMADATISAGYTGTIDEVSYYPVALGPQIIKQIYQNGEESAICDTLACPAPGVCVQYGGSYAVCIRVTSQIVDTVDVGNNPSIDRTRTITLDLVHTGLRAGVDAIVYCANANCGPVANRYFLSYYNGSNIMDLSTVPLTVNTLTLGVLLQAAPEQGWIYYGQQINLRNDADGDGIFDNVDIDSDNDGIANSVETTFRDTDLDGILDYLDLDSDNDGIPDIIEAGGIDVDRDGRVDNFVDTNPRDGLSDNIAPGFLTRNSDGDSLPDYRDLDSDGDGLNDMFENGAATTNTGPGHYTTLADAANDGWQDNAPAVRDTDGDAQPDYRDLDSDNDGVTDLLEAGGVDANGDGRYDNTADTTPVDGWSDFVSSNPLSIPDSDFDTIRDYRDSDSDQDGIPDVIENGYYANPADITKIADFGDADLNGWNDTLTGAPLDSDGDSVLDCLDLDSDNDGIPDIFEAGGEDNDYNGRVDGPFVDANENGYSDSLQSIPLVVPDSDGDGQPDFRDLDSDNDSILDLIENGFDDTNGDGLVDEFSDTAPRNGWSDSLQGVAYSTPDTDNDGAPDYRDLDSDNDSIGDLVEAGIAPYPTSDPDDDGVLDLADSDGDGISDVIDNAPASFGTIEQALPQDSGNTALYDYQELDSVTPGLWDINSFAPVPSSLDLDDDGIIDGPFEDVDEDGIADRIDKDTSVFGGIGLPTPSTDSPTSSSSGTVTFLASLSRSPSRSSAQISSGTPSSSSSGSPTVSSTTSFSYTSSSPTTSASSTASSSHTTSIAISSSPSASGTVNHSASSTLSSSPSSSPSASQTVSHSASPSPRLPLPPIPVTVLRSPSTTPSSLYIGSPSPSAKPPSIINNAPHIIVSIRVPENFPTIVINPVPKEQDVNMASSVVDISFLNPDDPAIPNKFEVDMCFGERRRTDKDRCLGFYNERYDPPRWECEDSCLKSDDSGRYCGTTTHFTQFALLLKGGATRWDGCNEWNDYIVGSYQGDLILVAAFAGGMICIGCFVILLSGTRVGNRLCRGKEGARVHQLRSRSSSSI